MRKLSLVILFITACGSKPKPAATTPAPAPSTAANVACDSPPCDQAAPTEPAPCIEAWCGGPAGNVSAEPARVTLPPLKCEDPSGCVNAAPAAACDNPSVCVNKAPAAKPPCDNPAGCI